MGSAQQSSSEILAEVLDSIHAKTFKVIPEGGNAYKVAKALFAGKVAGTWVHDVPHHGDLPVGDGEFHKYFISQMELSDGSVRTFVCVSMTTRFYKLGQGHRETARIAGYFEVPDFAAAEDVLEPLALALVPFNTIREIEELDDIADLI
jgi:hypothetical protein